MFFADVVKLANTLDLGSSASAWGFKSLHPHQHKPKSNTNKKVFGLGFFIHSNQAK